MKLLVLLSVAAISFANERRTVVVNPDGWQGANYNTRTAELGPCECAADPDKKYLDGRKPARPGMFVYACEYTCMTPAGELAPVTATNEEFDRGDRLKCAGVVYGPRGDPWGPKYPNRIDAINPNLPWTFRKTYFPELKIWSRANGCRGWVW